MFNNLYSKCIIAVLILFIGLSLNAQELTYKKAVKSANKTFKKKDYVKAVEEYLTAIKLIEDTTDDDAVVFKNYGISLLYTNQYVKSLENFDLAITIGQTEFKAEEIEEINALKKVAMRTLINTSQREFLMERPLDMTLANMGQGINSSYDDCCISFGANDTFFVFTSRRKPLKGGKTDDGQYFEDFYYSTRINPNAEWNNVKNLGKPINTKVVESTPYLTDNGNQMYYYRYIKPKTAKKKDGYGGHGDIFLAKIRGDKTWVDSMKLPETINSIYWDAHPYVTADGNTMYFVSDRLGSIGGKDIYMSMKDDSGQWMPAVNLGESINTIYDEVSPFLSEDGKSLYFSSNGLPGIGDYDVYKSTKNDDGTWSPAANMGYPVNTPFIDLFFRTKKNHEDTLIVASNRENGYGALDLYATTNFIDNFRFRGMGAPVIVEQTTTKGDTSDLEEELLTDIDTAIVEDSLFSEEIDSIDISSDQEEITSEPVSDEEISGPISDNKSFEFSNQKILFDFNKSNLRPDAKAAVDNLLQYMKAHSTAVVEISGHTDYVGSDAYNVMLSINRVKSVIEYLVDHGISKDKLLGRCYGETKPAASNNTDEGRQQNRRVESAVLGDAQVYAYKDLSEYMGVYMDQKLLGQVKNMNITADKMNNVKVSSGGYMDKYGNLSAEGLVFKVQIGAYQFPPDVNSALFSGVSNIETIKLDDGITRFNVGSFNTLTEASNKQQELSGRFADAFVVAYYNNERIVFNKALTLLK